MFDHDPGRNEKSHVICNQMQVRTFRNLIPSDETVTVFDLPCGACPSQAGNDLVADTYDVPDVFANKLGITKVVVVMKEIAPEVALLRVFYHLNRQVFISGDCTFQCFLGKKGYLSKNLWLQIVFLAYAWGKRHQTLFFQSQKEVACRVFFQLAVGLHPVPTLAEFMGNVTPSSVEMLSNERLDRGDIVCVQLS